MEPARLAAELFDQVIQDATQRGQDVKSLCRWSLVSRRWYDALFGYIYGKWSQDGHEHSILSMWQFLRAVLTNKRIANAVTEVDFRDWTFGLVYRHGRLALGAEDFNLIRRAMHDMGHDKRWDSFEVKLAMDGLRKADPTPLVALILASLPNLVKLRVHLPDEGTFSSETPSRGQQNNHKTRKAQEESLSVESVSSALPVLGRTNRGERITAQTVISSTRAV